MYICVCEIARESLDLERTNEFLVPVPLESLSLKTEVSCGTA